MALEVSIFKSAAIRPEQTASSKRISVSSDADAFGSVLSSTTEALHNYGDGSTEPGVESNKEGKRIGKSKESAPLNTDISTTEVKTDTEVDGSALKSVSRRDLSGSLPKDEQNYPDKFSVIGTEIRNAAVLETARYGDVAEAVSAVRAEPVEVYPLMDDEYGLGGAVTRMAAGKEGKKALTEAALTPVEGALTGGEVEDVIEEPGIEPLLLGNGQGLFLDNRTAEVTVEATGIAQEPEAAQAASPEDTGVFAEVAKAAVSALSVKKTVQSELDAGEQTYRINLASLLGGNGEGNGKGGQAGSLKAAAQAGVVPEAVDPVIGIETAFAAVSAGVIKGSDGLDGDEGSGKNGLLTDGPETGSAPVDNGGLTGIAAPVVPQDGVTAAAFSITGTDEEVSAAGESAVGGKAAALSPAGVNESAEALEAEQEPPNAEKAELLQGAAGGEKQDSKGAVKGGLIGAGQSLRERTEQGVTTAKRVVEQAEVAKVPRGKGNEVDVKAADGIDKSVKDIGTGNGVLPPSNKEGGLSALGDLTGGGVGGAGEDGSSQKTPQDFSALLAMEGQLKNVTVTETYSSAGTGAHLAEGVENTVKVYEKFAQAVKLSFLSGGKNVTLRLSPAHLGALQIKLHSDGKSVKAKVLVDSLAVKHLLESDSGKLKQLFAEQGMNMEEYSVALQEQSVGSGGSSGAELWQRRAFSGNNSMSRKTGPDIEAGNAVIHPAMNRAYGIGRDRGVDLFA